MNFLNEQRAGTTRRPHRKKLVNDGHLGSSQMAALLLLAN
jgi:hypothetical protein